MPATSDEPTSMDLNISCSTLPVAPRGEFFTPEGVEASLGTPMQIGLVTKPIVNQYWGMHSYILEGPCLGCRSNRAQLQCHQPMLSTLLALRHRRSWSGSDDYCWNSMRAYSRPLPCILTTGQPICSHRTQ